MSKIFEMLENKRQELLAEIARTVGPLEEELRQLDAALKAVKLTAKPSPKSALSLLAESFSSEKTVSEQILKLLERRPLGLTASKLTELLNNTYKREMEKQEVSWYLSKLKKERKLNLEHGVWTVSYHDLV